MVKLELSQKNSLSLFPDIGGTPPSAVLHWFDGLEKITWEWDSLFGFLVWILFEFPSNYGNNFDAYEFLNLKEKQWC